MIVLVLAVALWVLGWALATPKLLRWGAVAMLWAGAVLVHLTLPDDAALRASIGGDARTWGAVGVVAALLLAYRAGLAALRRRAAPLPPAPRTPRFPAGRGPGCCSTTRIHSVQRGRVLELAFPPVGATPLLPEAAHDVCHGGRRDATASRRCPDARLLNTIGTVSFNVPM